MSEEQLERRARIAKVCWLLCGVLLYTPAYFTKSIELAGLATVAWMFLALVLRDKYPDSFDRAGCG